MIEVGIILFVIGALVAWLASGDVERLGFVVALIGVVAIVLGLVLGLGDEGGDVGLFVPLLALGLAKARL